MKELIICGALGLRCKMLSAVAYWDGDTEVSEETYKAQKELLVKQMENIEMYDLTLENIEKYVTE